MTSVNSILFLSDNYLMSPALLLEEKGVEGGVFDTFLWEGDVDEW